MILGQITWAGSSFPWVGMEDRYFKRGGGMCVAMSTLHLDRVLIPPHKDYVCISICEFRNVLQIILLDFDFFFACLLQRGIPSFTVIAKNPSV